MFVLVLLVGLLCAVIGGERFVRGAVGLATWLRIPPGVVGATVAAFATSSPELTVGVLSAIDGQPELALGDAMGSNMVNLGIVFGIVLLISAVRVAWTDMSREATGFIVALSLLLISVIDGSIARMEGVTMVLLFIAWLMWVVRDARNERYKADEFGESRRALILFDTIFGLGLLLVAGRLIVVGSKDLGEVLGWNSFVVGSIVVAIGTSAPELVTTIVAARKGHLDVGIGTVLGSNIFNSLLIVGVAGWIKPISVDRAPTLLALFTAFLAMMFVVPKKPGLLGRSRGALLVASYGLFVIGIVGLQ